MSLRTLNKSMKQLQQNLTQMGGYCDSIINGLNTTQLDFGVINKFNQNCENTINILQSTFNSSSELEIVLKQFNSDIQGFIVTTNSLIQVGKQIENFSNSIENAFSQINELLDEFSDVQGTNSKGGLVTVSVSVNQKQGGDNELSINYNMFVDFYEDYKKTVSELLTDVNYWYTEIFEKDDT